MPPSWRLARNTIAGKPGRTALMVCAVALAAALVVAMSCCVASMQNSLRTGVEKLLGASDARVIHPFNGRFDEALLHTVRSWPEVALATGRLQGSLTLIHADSRRDPTTGQLRRSTPTAIGVEFDLEPRFRPLELVAGRLPQQPDEILLDPATRDELKAEVGDDLIVQRFGEPIALTVAGVYEQVKLGAVQRPLIRIDRTVLGEAAGHARELSAIAIILKDGVNVEAFCAAHADELPKTLALEPAEKVTSGFDRQIEASRFGFTIASILTFMSASFIIVTALTTAVTQRQREMAVTRAVGASRAQLFGSQLIVGLMMSAAGASLGIPIGVGLTGLLVWWFRDLLESGLTVSPLGLQLALIGSVAAGVLGAVYPAFMASRVSPLQAMTFQAQPPRQSSIVVAFAIAALLIALQLSLMAIPDASDRFLAYAWLGMPAVHIGYFIMAVPMVMLVALVFAGAMSRMMRLPRGMLARGVLATPFRHGFTAGALMVGISILVSTWSGALSLLNDWVGKIKFADGFAYRSTGIRPDEQQAIANLPFVEAICPIGYLPLRVIDRQIFGVRGLAPPNVTCVGFDPDIFFSINAVQWAAGEPASAIARLKDGTGVIVADRFLTTQRVKVGDTLKLGAGRMQEEFEIVGAVNSAGLDIATQLFGIRSQYMEFSISCVFMDWKTVERVFDAHDAYMMQIDFTTDVTDDQVSAAIADVAPGVQFKSGRFILDTVNQIATMVLAVQSTVAFASLVLACLGMGNVILANIHGRRFEYGVLRAVGAQRSVLARLILGEAALIALAAAIIGTILGFHLAWVGSIHYRELAGLPVYVRIPALPTAIGWLVLLVMTMIAALPGVLAVIRPEPSTLLAAGRNG